MIEEYARHNGHADLLREVDRRLDRRLISVRTAVRRYAGAAPRR